MLDFVSQYWWVAPVSLGMTEWFYAIFPRLAGKPRDIILPAVALVVVVLSIYLPRIIPASEITDLANAFVLWGTVTGIVKFSKRSPDA